MYQYRVSGLKACYNLFSYFDQYTLLSKKFVSYTLWKQIYLQLKTKNHLESEKIKLMIEKARMINKSNIM